MEICTLHASYQPLADCTLPRFKHSTIRGALGHQLRRLMCIRRSTNCTNCPLVRDCPYVETFDNSPLHGEFLPTIISCQNQTTDWHPGQELPVRVSLIAQASRHAPYFALALENMAQDGLGKQRHPFGLRKGIELRSDPLLATEHPAAAYRLQFHSPLRAKAGNRLAKTMDLLKITQLAQRRLQAIAEYSQQPLQLDSVEHPAQEISQSLRWLDIARYSNRQHEKMKFGGFVGTLDYQDPSGATARVLASAAKVHIGKQISFGYGHFSQEVLQ